MDTSGSTSSSAARDCAATWIHHDVAASAITPSIAELSARVSAHIHPASGGGRIHNRTPVSLVAGSSADRLSVAFPNAIDRGRVIYSNGIGSLSSVVCNSSLPHHSVVGVVISPILDGSAWASAIVIADLVRIGRQHAHTCTNLGRWIVRLAQNRPHANLRNLVLITTFHLVVLTSSPLLHFARTFGSQLHYVIARCPSYRSAV